MANIPNDILGEILSKLPVYSLLRLRWACKYWFDLITRDDDFIKMHILHSTSDYDQIINKTLVLISDGKVLYSSKYKDIFDTSSSSLKPAVMICENPFGYNFEILGSCNGLLYLRTSTYEYFLWNPSTTEFKKLPRFDKPYLNIRGCSTSFGYDHTFTRCSTICGFGYDHTMDDYKVVEIYFLHNLWSNYPHNVLSSTSIINIYTLGTNSWSTQIETNPEITELQDLGSKSGVLVNGALHWTMISPLGLTTILCFDVVKEKEHRDIQLPPFNSTIWHGAPLQLQVLNECLCIFLVDTRSSYENAELWMMMDYSTGSKSWTKLFAIDVRSLIKEINHEKNRKFVFKFTLKLLKYYSEDDGILMLYDQHWYEQPTLKYLITYYPKKDKATIENTCMEYWMNAEGYYIESLVSIKSGTYLSNAVEGPTIVTVKRFSQGFNS